MRRNLGDDGRFAFDPRSSALISGKLFSGFALFRSFGCSPCLSASEVGVGFPIPAMTRDVGDSHSPLPASFSRRPTALSSGLKCGTMTIPLESSTLDGMRYLPFADDVVRADHFKKHRNEFTFASAVEYEAEADAFMAGAAIPPARECTRANGDRVRFNRNSRYFAVQAPSGNLKTFHKISDKFMALGYFNWECGRTV